MQNKKKTAVGGKPQFPKSIIPLFQQEFVLYHDLGRIFIKMILF